MHQLLCYIAHEYVNKIYQSIKRRSYVGYVRNILQCTCRPMIWINTSVKREGRACTTKARAHSITYRSAVNEKKWKRLTIAITWRRRRRRSRVYSLLVYQSKACLCKSEKKNNAKKIMLCLDFDYIFKNKPNDGINSNGQSEEHKNTRWSIQ